MNQARGRLLRARLALLAAVLAGCTPWTTTQGLVDSVRPIPALMLPETKLDPRFSYLRVQMGQYAAILALGYVDPAPDGPVQVWYSTEGEVLRLREGRLVGLTLPSALGFPNWLHVAFSPLPPWQAIGEEARFVRLRDASPDYRYGVREQMTIRPIAPPPAARLQQLPAASLTWFEERAQDSALPPARYALDAQWRVVYGEQCLSENFCLSWQSWPAAPEAR